MTTEDYGEPVACGVPLQERLRKTPADSRLEIETHDEHGMLIGVRMIPVGHQDHEAADAIETLLAKVEALEGVNMQLTEQRDQARAAHTEGWKIANKLQTAVDALMKAINRAGSMASQKGSHEYIRQVLAEAKEQFGHLTSTPQEKG